MIFSPLEQFDAIKLTSIFIKSDFTFFHIIIPLILTLLLFIFIVFILRSNNKLIPTNLQRVCELSMEFIFNLIKAQIGTKGNIYFPFIFMVFHFILISNLLSLIPYGIALTSHIILIMWFSLSIGLSIFISGLIRHNIKFFKIFIPESPFLLLPALILIEIFSYIIRAFSLAIRLSANIMAGHTLVFIISGFVLNITKVKYWLFLFGFVFLFAVLCLELGVCFLQAYVYTVLILIYLSDVFNCGH